MPAGEVDLVFSFDSLVHVDASTLTGYLRETKRVLSPSGAAFLHHSNLKEYRRLLKVCRLLTARMPYRLGKLIRRQCLVNDAWRADDVSADVVNDACRSVGLVCSLQELVNWENRTRLIDCFSTLRHAADHRERVVWRNGRFMEQATLVKEFAARYPQGRGGHDEIDPALHCILPPS